MALLILFTLLCPLTYVSHDPPRTSSELSSIDEKTKTNFEELVLIEVDLANLEWKVHELGLRLNAQL
ncbi:rho GTPase-activating protein 25-like, partial [Trifolium medium]|nr:rho GTPase-activating protein 25-like [Trifolium medium]